ncbi:MAG: helix-turn-helix transcriptional regulator [bacterium]|nr:helix-turn-helix transcriptional regulator [bacterium]
MPKKNPNPSRLEEERHRAGLTRKQLAEQSDVNFRTIEAYEQGKNEINMAAAGTVRQLARTLKIPIENILED